MLNRYMISQYNKYHSKKGYTPDDYIGNTIRKYYQSEEKIIEGYQKEQSDIKVKNYNQMNNLELNKKKSQNDLSLYLRYRGLDNSGSALKDYNSSLDRYFESEKSTLGDYYNSDIIKSDREYQKALNNNYSDMIDTLKATNKTYTVDNELFSDFNNLKNTYSYDGNTYKLNGKYSTEDKTEINEFLKRNGYTGYGDKDIPDYLTFKSSNNNLVIFKRGVPYLMQRIIN